MLLITKHLCVNQAAVSIFHVTLLWEGRDKQDRLFLRLTVLTQQPSVGNRCGLYAANV